MSDTAKLILSVLVRVAVVVGLLTLIVGLLAGVNPVIAVARSVAGFVAFALLSLLTAYLLGTVETSQAGSAATDGSNQTAGLEAGQLDQVSSEARQMGALGSSQLVPAQGEAGASS